MPDDSTDPSSPSGADTKKKGRQKRKSKELGPSSSRVSKDTPNSTDVQEPATVDKVILEENAMPASADNKEDAKANVEIPADIKQPQPGSGAAIKTNQPPPTP